MTLKRLLWVVFTIFELRKNYSKNTQLSGRFKSLEEHLFFDRWASTIVEQIPSKYAKVLEGLR
jgi:hypothetical protein